MASAKPVVVLNKGWRDLVRKASQPAREQVADTIAGNARAMAPVASGDYRDSIRRHTDEATGNVGVVATDRKAHWIEAGTRRQKPRRVIGRAAEAAGYPPTAVGGG